MRDLVDEFNQRRGSWQVEEDDPRARVLRSHDLPAARPLGSFKLPCRLPECNRTFWPQHGSQRYCSSECYRKAYGRAARYRSAP